MTKFELRRPVFLGACALLSLCIATCIGIIEGDDDEHDGDHGDLHLDDHLEGPDPHEVIERLGLTGQQVAWVQHKELYWFESLGEMAATADTVVVGRVRELREGPIVRPEDSPDDPSDGFQTKIAEVEVDRSLSGGAAAGEVIEIEFERWIFDEDENGNPTRYRVVRADGGDEYQVGERGIYLLRRVEGATTFMTLNHQARIPIVDGQVEVVDKTEPLAADIDGLSEHLVLARLEVAVAAAARGEFAPVERGGR